jgi:GTPase SAR1 family protein
MDGNLPRQRELRNLVGILETLTNELAPLFPEDSAQVRSWRRSLDAVTGSLQGRTLRIAVVGSVKSGKSTFINAVLGRDLLKRGAGIITAFITRVRPGPEERGWVEIKSWQEINAEVNEAVSLVGLPRDSEPLELVDLRREEDRRVLDQMLQETRGDGLAGRETFDPNIVLIDAYLRGYGSLGVHVRDEVNRLDFGNEELHQHQEFVSEGSQAVYLRDMELQVPVPWLGEMVEIGDCQGSDSPNPHHFAMLQEYLLGSHCILYLISSRVGLRQADLKLIEAIKILRLVPQSRFVLNIDLDEHGSVENLQRLTERVGEELSLLVPGARVYAFSTLLHLLEAADGNRTLAPRERRRLDSWYEEHRLVEASRRGYEQFRADFQQLVQRERSRVLYGGILTHLRRVGRSMQDSLSTRQALLSKNVEELTVLTERIKTRQRSVTAALTTVEQTLRGLEDSLKDEVRAAVDSFFDTEHGPIISDTTDLIERYPVDTLDRSMPADTRRWLARLYVFYQEFRQALSRHIIDKVNLRIIDFAKNEEERIEKSLLETAGGYWDLLGEALRQYQNTLTDSGLSLTLDTPRALPRPERPGISPPAFSAFMERSEALGRSTLLLRFSLGRLRHLFSGIKQRVLRQEGGQSVTAGEQLFHQAVALVKKETKKELLTSFRDYRQNFKFAYLFSFTERYVQSLVQLFRDFGDATLVDIDHLGDAARQKEATQQDETEDLAIIRQRVEYAAAQLRRFEQELGSLGGS